MAFIILNCRKLKFMKKLLYLILVCGIFFGTITVESCQSTKSSTASRMLKFNFEKGKGYDYEMIMNMDQNVMGQKTQMDMTTYYSMDVVEDDGSIKTVNATYDRFKMKMDFSGFNIEVDSDKPLPNFGEELNKPLKMLNGLLGAVKGRKFVMKINDEGEILDISGFENMAQSIVDSLELGEEKGKELVKKFNEQFNKEKIKDQFARILYIFPNKEVKVGDSWVKSTTSMGMGGGKYISTYTVTEIEGDIVTLDEKSIIESTSDGDKMKGTLSGTLIIDSRSGLVVSADQDLKINSEAKGKSIEMVGKTKVRGKAR